MIRFKDEAQEAHLSELRAREAEDLAQILSQKYGIPYTDLGIIPVNTKALGLISEEDSKKHKIAAFARRGKNLDVALLTPNNKGAQQTVRSLQEKGFKVATHIASERSLAKAWERYSEISKTTESSVGAIHISPENLTKYKKEIQNTSDLDKRVQKEFDNTDVSRRVTNIIEIILGGALATEASDVHMEPREDDVLVRLRLDGILHDTTTLDHRAYKMILSRLKILSGVKLNIKKKAQDGRMSIKFEGVDVEIRSSFLPEIYGEAIVMRLLNPESLQLDMDKLGIEEKLLDIIKKEIKKPNGMILTTGPTGSGKTTSLYSFLNTVNEEGIKIITIEDPVEYHLEGISQTQVKKGYGFLEGLRAALRQDPDIIMVGEIRDTETAKIAVNAALTGHLVFSTLHTNNAAGALPRLIDLEVDPKVIGPAVTLALAQRLVRKLCGECKKKTTFTSEEKNRLQNIFNRFPESYKNNIEDWDTREIYVPGKCAECNNTGYKGRTGLYEGIQVDRELENTIVAKPSERELWEASFRQELLRMTQDGLLKVLSGITSLEEVERVVDIEE